MFRPEWEDRFDVGLGDEEGLRMAIRLARRWEAAKIRFVSAVTTGLASAFLLISSAGMMYAYHRFAPAIPDPSR